MLLARLSRSTALAAYLCVLLAPSAPAHSISLPEANPKRPTAIAPPDRHPDASLALAAPDSTSQQPPQRHPDAAIRSSPGQDSAGLSPPERHPDAGPPSTEPGSAGLPLPDRNPMPAREADAAPAGEEAMPLPLRKPPPPPEAAWVAGIRALMEYELPRPDRDYFIEAVRATYAGRTDAARRAIGLIKDDAATKLATWYYMRSSRSGADPKAVEAFRRANPDWPSSDLLRRRAERTLFDNDPPPGEVKAFFADSAPTTPAGRAALAHAHRKSGNEALAKSLLRAAWQSPELEEEVEAALLKRDGDLLTKEDHKGRVDRLLYRGRANLIPAALRTAALVGDSEKKKVEARAAVIRRVGGADKLLEGLPAAARKELGVVFSRVQWLRRNDREDEAWALLLSVNADPGELLDLEEWWTERRINVRGALNRGEADIAYEIAKNHGPLSGNAYVDAQFLAGWISLRFLDRPQTALTHFKALRTAASSNRDMARAEYWLGRAEQALGNSEAAMSHFEAAARYPFEYYGQLGAESLPHRRDEELFPPTPLPADQDVRRWLDRDMVKAIGILRSTGYENLVPMFCLQLARTLNAPGEGVMLAELARRMGQIHSSVRLSRIAVHRGLPLVDTAFPIDLLPAYTPLNEDVEEALLLALSRQESEFNSGAQSPAGARGLLQLMPGTAQAVARSYRVSYAAARLTSEPAYNMQLGAAHLRDLVDAYRGSYVLSLVAYNAGPGRVRDWTQRFGDPREPDVDPIDWVERIPFTETRNYVQKILESLQVFRARVGGSEGALRLAQDLSRGASQPAAATAAAR